MKAQHFTKPRKNENTDSMFKVANTNGSKIEFLPQKKKQFVNQVNKERIGW